MSQEIAIKPYYDFIRNSGEFIDTNLCSKLGMEFFLSQMLFKGDLTRVVYSKEDMAFRRRIELLGNGSVKTNELNIIGLDLPYAIYSQTGSFEADDRGWTQNTAQIVKGDINHDTGLIVKGAAVKTAYTATAFYSRREDVNIASQLIYWESQPKFPLYYIINHTLCGYPLDIPVFITIDSFNSNPDYEETPWLQNSKIFPIEIQFTIRSYQTLIESQDPDTLKLPIRFSGLYGYNDQEIVLTKECVLIWGDNKFTPSKTDACNIRPVQGKPGNNLPYSFADNPDDAFNDGTPKPKDKYEKKAVTFENGGDFVDGYVTEIVTDSDGKKQTELIQGDAVRGYFEESRDVVLDEFYQDNEKTTEHEINIKWNVKEESVKDFYSIIMYIPGILNTEIKDFSNEYLIRDLYPGSEYDLVLITKSKQDNNLTYKLNIKTKGTKVLGKLSDALVGKTFSLR